MDKGKTVYILGAGCSRADGLPVQADILKNIFTTQISDPIVTDAVSNFLEIDTSNTPAEFTGRYEVFEEKRYMLAEFLLLNFGNTLQRNRLEEVKEQVDREKRVDKIRIYRKELYILAAELKVTLEDIFTIFDKIGIQGEHWREYSGRKIAEIYQALKCCIIYIVCYQMDQIPERKTYEEFARFLIQSRINDGQRKDKMSVITMNWDTLLEQELYKQCLTFPKKIIPDYCFYSYSFKEDKKWVPSTLAKTKGYYNIKILKLHGSFNWLVCPRCGRIFVDFKDNIAKYIMGAEKKEYSFCRYCSNTYELEKRPVLESLFISPTYLKSFHDTNIKNIWHNAFIELTEAEKVVFIGYSLPNADFEFKHLLKETIGVDCKVEVVLTNWDNLSYYERMMARIGKSNRETILGRIEVPSTRYENFFGNGRIQYHYEGVQEYLKGLSK